MKSSFDSIVDSIRRYKNAFFLAFIFFCGLSFYIYSDIQATQNRFDIYEKQNRVMKFEVVKDILSENYIRAKLYAEDLAKEIIHSVEEKLTKSEIIEGLDHLDRIDNKLLSVIADVMRNDSRYMNVESDANDSFLANLFEILIDYSKDCSSLGSKRTWEQEKTLHENKLLVESTVSALKSMNSPAIVNGRVDNVYFWEFRKKEGDAKWTLISSMRIDEIEKMFYHSGGDIRSLETFEFLYPTYIYPKKDLAGRLLVDDRGFWRGNESKPLIVCQGFNLYDAIVSNSQHIETLKAFDTVLENEKNRKNDELLWKYAGLFLLGGLFLFVQWSSNVVVYTETLRAMRGRKQVTAVDGD